MLRLITILAALVTLAVPALAGGAGYTGKHPGDAKKVRAKDSSGKEWVLNDWREGSRPYAKNLLEREKQYRQKWGEHWAGKTYSRRYGRIQYTMSPGTWEWEEFVIIPDGKKACPYPKKSHYHPWLKSQALVFAPGGEEVTDVYAMARFGIYHVALKTKKLTYIGWMPKCEEVPYTGKRGGPTLFVFTGTPGIDTFKDGLDGKAGMEPTRSGGNGHLTVDPVTGRAYFIQRQKRGPARLRYMEKLLPYKTGGTEKLLPAFLDYKQMHKKFGAEPVMKNGQRAKPRFAVRTTPVRFSKLPRLIPFSVGPRILLSPDGKNTLVTLKGGGLDFGGVHLVEIDTGKDLGPIRTPAAFPGNILHDMHSGICSRYDKWMYGSKHTGSTGGPGKLFRVDRQTGKLDILYDSTPMWKDHAKRPAGYHELRKELKSGNDGPADAVTLKFETTCYQFQCPRTGAVMNGGWDGSGIRRYHDGFVTSLAQTSQMSHKGDGGRPEWSGQHVACFGSLQSCPDVAPNGDIYLTSCQEYGVFKGDELRLNGIRIIKLSRTDWPAKKPVNGYANQSLKPEDREKLMLEYAKKYIANYAELSRIYGGR